MRIDTSYMRYSGETFALAVTCFAFRGERLVSRSDEVSRRHRTDKKMDQ
jgi:hypothetical protein